MHLILTIHEVSICICLYQVNKNLSSIVGDLKQLVWGFLLKKNNKSPLTGFVQGGC